MHSVSIYNVTALFFAVCVCAVGILSSATLNSWSVLGSMCIITITIVFFLIGLCVFVCWYI